MKPSGGCLQSGQRGKSKERGKEEKKRKEQRKEERKRERKREITSKGRDNMRERIQFNVKVLMIFARTLNYFICLELI